MNSFVFFNPTKVVFGKGAISRIPELVPAGAKILLLFGGGSIKKNGVYDRIVSAIGGNIVFEQGGIQPNPTHEQCAAIAEAIRDNAVDFILAVGGGSVIDAAKYLAVLSKAASSSSAWESVEKKIPVAEALPLGVVLTLPASGSEMNSNAVISNLEKRTKRSFKSEKIFPLFAILDPEVAESLSTRQLGNGIVDTFSHVIEQYLTFPTNSMLQDRFSEGILSTLLEIGPSIVKGDYDLDLISNFMWASTCALNGFISCGVPQDWSSHMIGHELTAEYGISHAESVGVVLPGTISYMKRDKEKKLVQLGKRVFGLSGADEQTMAKEAIEKIEEFFISLGQPVRLSNFGLGIEAVERISGKIGKYPVKLGENRNIGEQEVREILTLRI